MHANRTSFACLLGALALLAGCASYARVKAPSYGQAWGDFARQASSTGLAGAPPTADVAMDETVTTLPEAARTVKKARRLLSQQAPKAKAIQKVMEDLTAVEKKASRSVAHDPRRLKRLRAEIEELRRRMEKRLLQVRSIEPTFAVGRRGRVRVAVVCMGEGLATIRQAERRRWSRFLAQAGFDPNPVFLNGALCGGGADAASVRVAAARLGADAVLAYATFAATTTSPLGESAAVLSFAKCMFVDVRTEYLYFNAEGEAREKTISLPWTVNARAVEARSVSRSIEALRREIGGELRRLEQDER